MYELQEGDSFGEIPTLLPIKNTADPMRDLSGTMIETINCCDVYTLSKEALDATFKCHRLQREALYFGLNRVVAEDGRHRYLSQRLMWKLRRITEHKWQELQAEQERKEALEDGEAMAASDNAKAGFEIEGDDDGKISETKDGSDAGAASGDVTGGGWGDEAPTPLDLEFKDWDLARTQAEILKCHDKLLELQRHHEHVMQKIAGTKS
jgi:hypothetical protein